MKKTTRNRAIAGAAVAGVAAAAATAGILVRRRGGTPITYHVRPTEDGWTVGPEGADAPASTHSTKRAAVTEARRLAGEHAPSQLVIHRTDGTVQARHSYEVDGGGGGR
jgi:hypothetical protein